MAEQNYANATSTLDDAVRKSSRFNGIQDALDNFLNDQKAVERNAIKSVLAADYKAEYDGLQLSDLLTLAQSDSALAAVLNANDFYPYNSDAYGSNVFSAAERIRMLTADTFLNDYCGIILEKFYFHKTDGGITYGSGVTTGNFDTGAITGLDAGGNNELTAVNVVPEIANNYSATSASSQIIYTGSNDWLVSATDSNDTIYSGGTDSINAASGADVIFISGNDSTVHTGAEDLFADTVNVASNVKTVSIFNLEGVDSLVIDGSFTPAAAKVSDDTLSVTDLTGNRTFIINGWTSAQYANVTVNGSTQKLGAWLSDFVDYSPASDTAANSSTAVINPITVNLDDVSSTTGSFSLLTSARNATFQDSVASGEVGNVSSVFPNVTSFKTHGLTVELWGTAADSEAKTVDSLTLDTMSDAQKNIFAGLYKWWVKEAVQLNEDSYGLQFNDGDIIKVFFYSDSSDTLAFVRNHGSGKDLELGINMSHYSSITSTDADGSGASLLDRTIAHEMTHAVMAATVHNFNSLPQFINEGIAELTHGIDDERGHRIWELAGAASDSSKLAAALDLNDTSTGNNDSYAAGYMFMRYFAKQAALDTANSIALGDATVSVSLSGNNETYYANLNSTNIERAVNTASDSNFSVGTAKDRAYSIAAGITQQIYTTDEDWTIRDIGNNNTLVAGAGNDYVTLTGSNNAVSLGGGEDRVSLAGGFNSISTADGNDSIRIGGANNTVLTGAGDDSVTFAAYSNSAVNASNFVDTGDGNDIISVYNNFQTVDAGADEDTLHIRGNYNSINGGAGDDDINIYTAHNTVTGGAGVDQFVIWSNSVTDLTVTDFDIAAKEYFYFDNAVSSAYYNSVEDKVYFGNIGIHFSNADNINDFLDMNIYNASDSYTTLKDLMGAKIFNWDKDGDYYFLIEDGTVNIADNALAYDGSRLQSGKAYVKLSLNGDSVSVISDIPALVNFDTADNSLYSLNIDSNLYNFRGDSVFLNSYAYSGDFTLADSMYFWDSDGNVKLLQFTGSSDSDSVNISLEDSLAVYLNSNQSVSLFYDNVIDIYTATDSSLTKESAVASVSSDTVIAEDVFTFRGYNFNFGSDVFATDFTELNHYLNDFLNHSTLLYSGSLSLEGRTFTIENSSDGITLLYDSDASLLNGISNFSEGERINIDNDIFSVIDGRIIRSSDNLYYNGDWNYFLADLDSDYYWGAVTGWYISDNFAVYTLADSDVVTVSGLILDGVSAVDGVIDGLSVSDNIVHISDSLIGNDDISFTGDGYLLNISDGSNTSLIGSDYSDSVLSANISADSFSVFARAGNDSILINRISAKKACDDAVFLL